MDSSYDELKKSIEAAASNGGRNHVLWSDDDKDIWKNTTERSTVEDLLQYYRSIRIHY